MAVRSLLEAAETAADLANPHVESWLEGAIFPSEMAFFLATCEVAGVTRVIESGRQDGYSTVLLGEWAAAGGREIISVGLELDAERAAKCRERVRGLPVTLVKGSAYNCIARAAKRDRAASTAFLVDGPNGWPAISMMSATIDDNVSVMALHNLAEGLPTRDMFLDIGGPEVFYESALADGGPKWRALLAKERALSEKQGVARDLYCSSLGVLRLNGTSREKFALLGGWQYGFHQPRLVRTFYKAGWFLVAQKLYGLSYRLVGR
jgi:hypothetical protein